MIEDAPEYCRFSRTEQFRHFGLKSAQNKVAMNALSILLEVENPKTIVEFGTGFGGLSILLGIWARINGCDFKTYDQTDIREEIHIFEKLSINFECVDIHTAIPQIAERMRQPGKTIVFCDNGNKHREIVAFAPFLKDGDLILMHDYAKDDRFFSDEIVDKFWGWHESSKKDSENLDLIPVHEKLLEYAAWGCFKKEVINAEN